MQFVIVQAIPTNEARLCDVIGPFDTKQLAEEFMEDNNLSPEYNYIKQMRCF